MKKELEVLEHILKVCKDNEYLYPVMTKHYGVICISKFLFTWGILVDIDETGYNRRYCYDSIEGCMTGYNLLQALDSSENPPFDPPDPYWIKRKGIAGEIINPNNPNLQNDIK